MKRFLSPVLTLVLGLASAGLFATGCTSAQAETGGTIEELEVKTSAKCGQCKRTIEKALHKTEGVKSADLNLDDKVVTVKYDADQTDPETIREAIAASGYDADDVPCDKEAHDGLPRCCQMGSKPH